MDMALEDVIHMDNPQDQGGVEEEGEFARARGERAGGNRAKTPARDHPDHQHVVRWRRHSASCSCSARLRAIRRR